MLIGVASLTFVPTKSGDERGAIFGQSYWPVTGNEGGQLSFYCSEPLFIAFQASLSLFFCSFLKVLFLGLRLVTLKEGFRQYTRRPKGAY